MSLRFIVEGRVQGVGFRWWVRSTATDLGLIGFVRNCPDGTVEVVAAGPEESIEALRSAIRSGPPTAHVTNVRETDAPPPQSTAFEIRH